MSLSYQPLQPVRVLDPIVDINTINSYAVVEGGRSVKWQVYNTSAISNANISFTCPPPSGSTMADRKVFLLVPVRLTFTGTVTTSNSGFTPNVSLLNANWSALRKFPIQGSIINGSSSINGQSVDYDPANWIHALGHFHTDNKLLSTNYSMSPAYEDQSQNYSDLLGGTRNPLGFYADGLMGSPEQRAGFPMTFVSNAAVAASTGGTAATATVDTVIIEPLMLSPFTWSCEDKQGFYNVTTMNFNFQFVNNGMRMWSQNQISPVITSASPAATVTTNITGITASFNQFSPAFSYASNQPQMLFKYVSP